MYFLYYLAYRSLKKNTKESPEDKLLDEIDEYRDKCPLCLWRCIYYII